MLASVIIPQRGRQLDRLTIDCVDSLNAHHQGHEIIVAFEERQGLSKAWNQGAERAVGDALIFLNNDTLTHAPWIHTVLDRLAEDAWIIGAGERREHSLNTQDLGIPSNYLQGWLLAMRTSTWHALEGFDERFQLYFSDTDFQARAVDADYSLYLEHLAVTHTGHATTRKRPDRSAVWNADRQRFLDKWTRPCTSCSSATWEK